MTMRAASETVSQGDKSRKDYETITEILHNLFLFPVGSEIQHGRPIRR